MSQTDDELELAPELGQVEALLLAAREVPLPPDLAARARAAAPSEPASDADVAFGRFLVERGEVTGDQLREAHRHLGAYRVLRPEVNLAQVLAKHGLCDKARLLAAHEAFLASLAPAPAAIGSPVEEAVVPAPAKHEPAAAPKLRLHARGGALDDAGPRRRPRRLLAGLAAALALGASGAAALAIASNDRRRRKEEFLAVARGALAEGGPALAAASARRAELPAFLLEDPEVQAAGKTLDAARVRADARAASKALLAGLASVRDADERLTLCSKAVAADPTHADALVARARARYAVARSRARGGVTRASLAVEALADLEEALRQAPDQPLAYLVKGQLLLRPRRPAEAEAALRAALDRGAGAVGALAEGLLLSLQGQPEAAITACTRALTEDPTLVDAYLARARARLSRREFGKALDDASAALRQDPGSPDALTLQAEGRYFATASSDRTGALHTLEQALRLDPTDPHALALRAYVRLQRDRIGDLASPPEERVASKRDAERAIAGDAEEPLAHLTLAELAADVSPIEAKQHASRAIECGRHLLQTWLCRGRLRGREADEYAIHDFDEVLRLDPLNAVVLTNKAAVLFSARRDAEQAAALLDQAIAVDPDLPWPYYWRGMIALAPPRHAQKYALAVSAFSDAIERQPQFPDAYFRRACAYHDTGRYFDCLKDLDVAESQRDQRASSAVGGTFQQHWVDLLRAHALFFTRQYPEARAAYEAYRRSAPPGDKAMPGVMRRLESLRRFSAGELTADELAADRTEVGDGR